LKRGDQIRKVLKEGPATARDVADKVFSDLPPRSALNRSSAWLSQLTYYGETRVIAKLPPDAGEKRHAGRRAYLYEFVDPKSRRPRSLFKALRALHQAKSHLNDLEGFEHKEQSQQLIDAVEQMIRKAARA